jgi:hypothetical protein
MPTIEERVSYLEGFEARFDAIDRRFEVQDEKTSRQFTWVVGIQVTTLIAIVGALLTRP